VPPGFHSSRPSHILAMVVLTTACFPGLLLAQQPAAQTPLEQPSSASPAASPIADPPKLPRAAHHFWDKENDWLFAGVGASRALDFNSTLNFRRRGRDEVFLTNDIVDDHPAFAAVEAGATGLSIGLAYVFHHYNHHKLERWTSIVHMSAATTGAVRNYCLKTAHSTNTNSSAGLQPSAP
jgi:hypothetical protein